jgi:hypothetical protein
MDLREIGWGVWSGFTWLRIGIFGGLLWMWWWTFGFWRHGVSLLGYFNDYVSTALNCRPPFRVPACSQQAVTELLQLKATSTRQIFPFKF